MHLINLNLFYEMINHTSQNDSIRSRKIYLDINNKINLIINRSTSSIANPSIKYLVFDKGKNGFYRDPKPQSLQTR